MAFAHHLLMVTGKMYGKSMEVRGRSEQGFTLIELMTVVAIMALAAAIAIPNYQAWYAASQLKTELVTLSSNMNLARSMAKTRNMTITVTVAFANSRVAATYTDPSNTSAACLANSKQCAIETQVMSNRVTGLGGTTTFQFNSMGLRVGGGAVNQSLQLIDPAGLTYEIQVTPAGRIRWCTVSPCP